MTLRVLMLFLAISATALGCSRYDTQDNAGQDLQKSGIMDAGGVQITFYFPLEIGPSTTLPGKVCFSNLNYTPVSVYLTDTSTGSELVHDFFTLPSDEFVGVEVGTNCTGASQFAVGHQVTGKIYIGYSSIYGGTFNGRDPDVSFTGTLGYGYLTITLGASYEVVLFDMPAVKGVACTLSVRHQPGSPTAQSGNMLGCQNLSSDIVDIRFVKLHHVSGTTYAQDFEVVEDHLILSSDSHEPVAVTIYAGDPYALQVQASVLSSTYDYKCFSFDPSTGSLTVLTCTVSF